MNMEGPKVCVRVCVCVCVCVCVHVVHTCTRIYIDSCIYFY